MHRNRKKQRLHGNFGTAALEREARIDLAERPAGGLAVAFLGASGTVTGSRYLLQGEFQP